MFKFPSVLISHYREVHNAFPQIFQNHTKFICNQCPNIYLTEKSLKTHINWAHVKTKKRYIQPRVSCKFCAKTYASKERLKDHIVIEHENSAQFPCETCQRRLPSAKKLKVERYFNSKIFNLTFQPQSF